MRHLIHGSTREQSNSRVLPATISQVIRASNHNGWNHYQYSAAVDRSRLGQYRQSNSTVPIRPIHVSIREPLGREEISGRSSAANSATSITRCLAAGFREDVTWQAIASEERVIAPNFRHVVRIEI